MFGSADRLAGQDSRVGVTKAGKQASDFITGDQFGFRFALE